MNNNILKIILSTISVSGIIVGLLFLLIKMTNKNKSSSKKLF